MAKKQSIKEKQDHGNESNKETPKSQANGNGGVVRNNQNCNDRSTETEDSYDDMQEEIQIRRRYDDEMKSLLDYVAKAKEQRAFWTKETSETQKQIEELCQKIVTIQEDRKLPLFDMMQEEHDKEPVPEVDEIHEIIKEMSTLRATCDIEFDFEVFDSIALEYETRGIISQKQKQAMLDIAEAVRNMVEFMEDES